MSTSNSIPIPKNWTFWHVLGVLVSIIVATVSVVVKVVNNTTDLKLSNATQEIPRLTKQLEDLDTKLDEISKSLIVVENNLKELSRKEIVISERVRDIDELENKFVGVTTKIGAHEERLKSITESTQLLTRDVAEVDKKIFGTETQSENVKSKVAEVSTEVDNINTEVDTHGDQLQRIADAVKEGFKDDPEVEPLLKHIAVNEQQNTTSEIVETIGQIKSEQNNDPSKVSLQLVAELGVDSQSARAIADERLSIRIMPEFYEMIPTAALPLVEPGVNPVVNPNPFSGIEIKANPDGETIYSLCKRYEKQVSVNRCYDYFLRRYAEINDD